VIEFITRFFREYRSMLKATELEEGLDLILFRPFAYVLVKIFQPTPVTPNQITLISLILGLMAGFCFWQGSTSWVLAGAIFLFWTNVFDCADGMLARVRSSSSVIGYILDGMVDYITHIVVFVSILHGLSVRTGQPGFVWGVGVPAGISFAWWCAMVDRFRNQWQDRVYDKRSDSVEEVRLLREISAGWKAEGSHPGQRMLISFYTFYVSLWYTGPVQSKVGYCDGQLLEKWKKLRQPVMGMALFTGPTMHLFLIMVAGISDKLMWYVWFSLVFGTLWGFLVLALKFRAELIMRVEMEKDNLHESGSAGCGSGDPAAPTD
jgi:CDP-alcohol phosphatidyltransferase